MEDQVDLKHEVEQELPEYKLIATPDPFEMLSQELNNPKYEILPDDIQREYGEKKFLAQKKLTKLVLNFQLAWDFLIIHLEKCSTQVGDSKFFREIIIDDGKKGTKKSKKIDLFLFERIRNVDENTKNELVDEMVETYNLSYPHFTKVVISKLEKLCFNKIEKVKSLERSDSLTREYYSLVRDIETLGLTENLTMKLLRKKCREIKTVEMQYYHYRNQLITTNIKLCLAVARRYETHAMMAGVSFADILAEGIEGLIKAVERYLAGIDVKVTSYAEYWVNQRVGRYIKNNNSVRIPVHVLDDVTAITRRFKEHAKEFGSTELPSKKYVETELGSKFAESVWQLAILRYRNTPVVLNCATASSSHEETGIIFDAFEETYTEKECLTSEVISEDIWEKAREILTETEFSVIEGVFKSELTFVQISESLGFDGNKRSVSLTKQRALNKLRERLVEDGIA
ncbi:MAG: sigma-70 family RNA polymerase sigma factor [Endozoicomonadaceae bacterium]|nr:sigma-70 family RNA polymerase sigma factor [Endozoicomonadaceae bacterium]